MVGLNAQCSQEDCHWDIFTQGIMLQEEPALLQHNVRPCLRGLGVTGDGGLDDTFELFDDDTILAHLFLDEDHLLLPSYYEIATWI